ALMAAPELLVLDEPASGLDLAGRELLVGGMERAVERGTLSTSVVIAHHLEDLPATTTHALLLREGSTIAAAPAPDGLTGEALSACFGLDVTVDRRDDRWTARAQTERAGYVGLLPPESTR